MKGANLRLRAGTTLVELLITIVFLAVAVVPILTLINSSQSRANETRQRMIALGVAQDEIENAKSATRTGGLATGNSSRSTTPAGALYPLQITTKVQTVAPFDDIQEVQVEVVYDDKGNKIRLDTRFKS